MLAAIHPARPSEAITREQQFEPIHQVLLTRNLREKEKGSITKGKLADLTVLSQDIFGVPIPELPKTQSVLTMWAEELFMTQK
jgi:predicted amidohydrolase YtcJ